MSKNEDNSKFAFSKIAMIGYGLTAVPVLIKFFLLRVDTYQTILAITFVFFILGLIVYVTPAEILLRLDRGTGYLLSKLGPFENSGFERASIYYEVFGILFMLFAVLINIIALLFI
jgi:hypothetical protein